MFSPKKLKSAREARRLTRRALGLKIGVDSETILNWERGKTVPSINKAVILAKSLRRSLRFFIETDAPNVGESRGA